MLWTLSVYLADRVYTRLTRCCAAIAWQRKVWGRAHLFIPRALKAYARFGREVKNIWRWVVVFWPSVPSQNLQFWAPHLASVFFPENGNCSDAADAKHERKTGAPRIVLGAKTYADEIHSLCSKAWCREDQAAQHHEDKTKQRNTIWCSNIKQHNIS